MLHECSPYAHETSALLAQPARHKSSNHVCRWRRLYAAATFTMTEERLHLRSTHEGPKLSTTRTPACALAEPQPPSSGHVCTCVHRDATHQHRGLQHAQNSLKSVAAPLPTTSSNSCSWCSVEHVQQAPNKLDHTSGSEIDNQSTPDSLMRGSS
jgi:hypothetical protein